MFSTCLNFIFQAIEAALNWFTTILDSVGAGGYYLAFVTMALSVAFLLAHFGSSFAIGSDLAGKAKDKIAKGGGKYASGKFTNSKQQSGRFSPGVDRTTTISQYHKK